MLAQRRSRFANIPPALGQRSVFVVYYKYTHYSDDRRV